MGMQPIPRPPFGYNPRRPEERDLDDATERDHRAREALAARPRNRMRRFLHAVRLRARR